MNLFCKLPRWLGGGHKWRRLTKKERETTWHGYVTNGHGDTISQVRRCRRCPAIRIVKPRKVKGETT